MQAIIETGGKQYEAIEGRYVDVELLDAPVEESFNFDKVVMIVDGEKSVVGQPYVEGAVVEGKILAHAKDKKIIVYKQRRKKGYRKKQGHRQEFTRIMIEKINLASKVKKTTKKVETVEVVEQTTTEE